ncbi:MAG: aldose epimerase family protein [Mangrovicoccus sp.]
MRFFWARVQLLRLLTGDLMLRKAPDIFGEAPDGSPVFRVELRGGGACARLITWGASLQSFRLNGIAHDLVLGCEDLSAYFGPMLYFGATVGRVANRIARGKTPLLNRPLELECNEPGRGMLHGGSQGAAQVNWQLVAHDDSAAQFSVVLPDGQGGFPGNCRLTALFGLDDQGRLSILYEAEIDAPSFCNLAHHSYWNLAGGPDLRGHRLSIAADHYLPVTDAQIPLGPPAPVAGTEFDYRQPSRIGLEARGPVDHNFCLHDTGELRTACVLEGGELRLSLSTTAPGLQVYDGAALSTAPFTGHNGIPYEAHAGVALEPQHWPDAPNHPGYPSILLRPGEVYRQFSRFQVTRHGAAA